MSIATPVITWIAALNTGTAVGNASITVTLNITQAWEVQVPFEATFGASVSLDPAVNIYPSSDGGASYDTLPVTSFAITRLASGKHMTSLRLTTGQYAIEMRNSGPSATFAVETAMVLTAISIM